MIDKAPFNTERWNKRIWRTLGDVVRFQPSDAIEMLVRDGVVEFSLEETCVVGSFEQHDDAGEQYLPIVADNCNFILGLPHSVGVGNKESLELLVKLHLENREWGRLKWLALKCGQKPLDHVIDQMKNVDYWDDELDALQDNASVQDVPLNTRTSSDV